MRILLSAMLFTFALVLPVTAQDSAVILTPEELARTVPPGFYFQGLSAPTQMRNSAAARFGANRYVLAGFVDTSGYAAEIRSKYEGFLITDSPIKINGTALAPGAYGFGFSNDGKLTVLDLTASDVLSVSTTKDNELKRPRPLMMSKTSEGVRLYNGKNYVVITAN
jgi:hypothetical protein